MKLTASHTIDLGLGRLTISPSGLTASVGPRGASVSLNTRGEAGISLGIPGIPGLSFRKRRKLFGRKSKK